MRYRNLDKPCVAEIYLGNLYYRLVWNFITIGYVLLSLVEDNFLGAEFGVTFFYFVETSHQI